jgi:hypothetical protein
MPMTTEQRIELLKKAREAKKLKCDARKQEKIDNPPPKGRPKKVVEETKTLDLTEVKEEVKEEIKAPEIDSEPEIVEEIIYEPKTKKKKKKIVRKIIRQQESSSDSEVEEEIIYEKPPKRTTQARVKKEKMESEIEPKPVEIKKPNPFFCY